MKVKGTFLSAYETEEDLDRNLRILKASIKEEPCNMSLTTDEDELVGNAVEVFKEDDHIVIIYEVNEKFKDELIKEGFEILN